MPCTTSNINHFIFLSLEILNQFWFIYILNRTTGKPMGGISYTDNIREIFSLKLLFDVQVPGILVENDEYHDKSIMADPNLNFWIKQKKL